MKLKKAVDWIKSNLITILITIIGILGAGIAWRYHKRKVSELKDRADILEATQNIKALNAKRTMLENDANKHTEEIKVIDKKLLENKRKIVEAHEYIEPLNDKEVLSEFQKLGY